MWSWRADLGLSVGVYICPCVHRALCIYVQKFKDSLEVVAEEEKGSRRRKKIIRRQWDYWEFFHGLKIINQFVTWTFFLLKASPEFNMQHGLMLVPESQTQAFNLVIMCKFFSALPIFHSSRRVSSWATLGCKWVSKWNKGIKKGNRLFRQEKQCQGGETDAFLYPWDVKSPITCSAQSVKTRKPQMKKNHRSREKYFWL